MTRPRHPSTAEELCPTHVVELYSILQLYILYILYSSTASTLYSALHTPSDYKYKARSYVQCTKGSLITAVSNGCEVK